MHNDDLSSFDVSNNIVVITSTFGILTFTIYIVITTLPPTLDHILLNH